MGKDKKSSRKRKRTTDKASSVSSALKPISPPAITQPVTTTTATWTPTSGMPLPPPLQGMPPPPFIPFTNSFSIPPPFPFFPPPSAGFLPNALPFSPLMPPFGFPLPPPTRMGIGLPPPQQMQINQSIDSPAAAGTSQERWKATDPTPISDSEEPENVTASDRKRKRKADEKNKEKERKKEKDKTTKFVSKALTLGELVEEAKQRNDTKEGEEIEKKKQKKKEELKQALLESVTTLEEENAILRKADELPPITSADYDSININDEGEQFDPRTVQVPESNRRMRLIETGQHKSYGSALFEEHVLDFACAQRAAQPYCPPAAQQSALFHTHGCRCGAPSDEESDEDSDAEQRRERMSLESKAKEGIVKAEIDRKRNHPAAVSSDICFNEPAMANDGPICKCSQKAKQGDMRHGYYPGEAPIDKCDPDKENSHALYHYVLRVTPPPASLKDGQTKTKLVYNNEFYFFEGFSIFLHRPLPDFFPRMPISRWSAEYEFYLTKEELPENTFTVRELELYYSFVFEEMLELVDLKRFSPNVTDGCPFYHVMPRYVAKAVEVETYNILPMRVVLQLLAESFRPLFTQQETEELLTLKEIAFKDATSKFKQQLLFRGDKKPTTLRADTFYIQRGETIMFDHTTNKPSIYVSGHNPVLQGLQRKFYKMKHLNNIKGLDLKEQHQMAQILSQIDKLKTETCETRRVVVSIPCEGYMQTGLYPDVTVHAVLLCLAAHHLRYHCSLEHLEDRIGHRFQNRGLLELSLTHPSFKNNFGTNADHAKNTLINCAYRKKYTGEDRKDKKRGIHVLMNIMSQQAQKEASGNTSHLAHNERLEYLGDAVVEMIASSHLYFMLPHHNEGGLATYRSALVQNRNLANLAKNLRVDEWLLFAHQGELCHEADFRHAMANTFEALIAAIYLDSNLDICDRIFSDALWSAYPNTKLREIWDHPNEHILKREFPDGDRHLIEESDTLKKLTEFEKIIHVKFQNIRLLAKAFTRRSIPYNELTKGHNQRLEWLGDSVLQLVVSDYLYKHFPLHHEGHLSLLRTSLVSNKTQATICEELCMREFVLKPVNASHKPGELRLKDKADLVEAVIGAIFVDRGWVYAQTLVRVLFLPRLKYFIESNRWNDPKSRLQQMCLTLRQADSRDPDMPEYKVLQSQGSTNSRVYTVAVYFRNKRLAEGKGGTIHEAQMGAARVALAKSDEYFPHIKNPLTKHTRQFFTDRNLKNPHGMHKKSSHLLHRLRVDIQQQQHAGVSMPHSLPLTNVPYSAPLKFFPTPPPGASRIQTRTGPIGSSWIAGQNRNFSNPPKLPMLQVRIIESNSETLPPPPPAREQEEHLPPPPPEH